MSAIFLNVETNTAPTVNLTLEHNGVAIDLTGASVILVIVNANTGIVTNSGHQSCTITSAISGKVSYTAQATDFPAGGRYTGGVKITYPSGQVERLYENIVIIIRSKIA